MSKGLEELKQIELKWQYGVFTFIPNFEIIEKELNEHQEIKTYMQQYGTENTEETRRVLHNVWVARQTFKTDIANVIKALGIIKEKRVDVAELVVSANLETYNSVFRLVEKWQLTQEEYDLLREVLL